MSDRATTPKGENGAGLLIAREVSVGYTASPVVKAVSVRINSGELVAIVGPNGAGKSTLLKAIAGVLVPMSGQLVLNGEDVTGLSSVDLARRGLGYVPQVDDVFDTLSVAENLEMGGYLLPRHRVSARADELLDLLPQLRRLYRRVAGTLSGGERKLVAIARALMLEPRALALDEPTASLSSEMSDQILGGHLRQLADDGCAVLLVEQKVRQALHVADRSYVLVAGRVVLEASGVELLARSDLSDVFLGGASSSFGMSYHGHPSGFVPEPGAAS